MSMKRLLQAIISLIVAPLRTLPLRLLILMSTPQRVRGVEVRDVRGARDASIIDKLNEALALLGQFAPVRLDQLRRYLSRIVITGATGPEYWPSLRACVARADWVHAHAVSEVALMLVHEATHARIDHCGIRVTEHTRERVERLCMKREAEVAARMPDAEKQLTRIASQMAAPWWSAEDRLERRLKELSALGCPTWVIAVVRYVASRA